MALIYFYDASELDKKQLETDMTGTDHHWNFIDTPITMENLDAEAEVISVFVSSTVTKEMIDNLPKLKLIACRSTGFDNVDLVAAAGRGITVTNVPTYGESTVAEYAFTLLLALRRKLPSSLGFLNQEIDAKSLRGSDLHGKTLGVIGTGHIGQHVIKIAKGFEMHVVAFDPFAKEELAKEYGFEYMGLDDLLKQSDVVTLHAPLTHENRHIINAEKLALMKPTATLINTARGELVDTQALADSLERRELAGAALDVLEGEQLFNMHEEVALLRSHTLPKTTAEQSLALMALNKMPNVILTPHNAFNTSEAIGRINKTTCQNIIKFWFGDIPNKVQPAKTYTGKLLMVRHTESEWNATGRWSGRRNVHLSQKGFHETGLLGQAMQRLDIRIDKAYCSEQLRTMETLEGILNACQQFDVQVVVSPAIDERDYGDYTGKNKWDMLKLIGEVEFNKMRRGWDYPIPKGESLKMVYERAIPFYQNEIVPQLLSGKNILLVAHGNSLRALMKYIEAISDEDVEKLEMPFGEIMIYDVDKAGRKINKSSTKIDSPAPNA